jgi:SAM-dependent methyltransferase
VAEIGRRIERLLTADDRSPDERARLGELMCILAALPPPPDPVGLYPRYGEFRETFLAAAAGTDFEALEEAFLALYCHLHGHEAPYTESERRRVDETGGYWCHAGGLSPVLKAPPFVRDDTVLGDFGAGNGLQGLLIQKLRPHRLTVQIEISSRMVEAGRALAPWLSVPGERVRWIVGDVLDHEPDGMDFIYLYRPVRPVGEGRKFYERFAAALARSAPRPVVVFSVADCLAEFLGTGFEPFHADGHLTCFRRAPS